MNLKRFALIFGIVYIALGIAGFFPALPSPPAATEPRLAVTALQGSLFGLFPVNVLASLLHLGFGLWALAAARAATEAPSMLVARTTAIVFVVLTVMGVVPGLNTVFGLMPLYRHDIWLHALTAIAAAYFAYYTRARAET